MDINKKKDLTPTPNNTPKTNAPIQQKGGKQQQQQQQQKAASSSSGQNATQKIVEQAMSQMAQGDLVSMMEEKLSGIIGMPSGYISDLHPSVKRRLKALKNIQDQHSQIESQFREEILELEKKYLGLYTPLYVKRSTIINGNVEPTDEECEREDSDIDEDSDEQDKIVELDDDEEEEEEQPKPKGKGGKNQKEQQQQKPKEQQGKGGKNQKEQKPKEPEVKGVPEFWLTALLNHRLLAEIITENDFPAMKHLQDIQLSYGDEHSYTLTFAFSPNEFFNNKTLTKTYTLQNTIEPGLDEMIYVGSEGCTIDWKPKKDLTVKIESRKQKNKGNKKTRTVQKTVEQESFFRFFKPPVIDEENPDPDEENQLEQDYEIGDMFKTSIIPHAVDWFTGKALRYEDDYDDYDDEEDYDDEDIIGSDDDDEDDDDDDDNAPRAAPEKPTECKQQ